MKGKLPIGLLAVAVAAGLLAAHGSSVRAQPVASIRLPAPGATKQLYPGCNNISLTFPDGTGSETVVQAVTPAGAVEAMWRHNAALSVFEAFSPAAPQASDLLTVNFLDSVWLCVAAALPPAATPPPAAPTATPVPPPTTTHVPPPAPTATPVPWPACGMRAYENWVTNVIFGPGDLSGGNIQNAVHWTAGTVFWPDGSRLDLNAGHVTITMYEHIYIFWDLTSDDPQNLKWSYDLGDVIHPCRGLMASATAIGFGGTVQIW